MDCLGSIACSPHVSDVRAVFERERMVFLIDIDFGQHDTDKTENDKHYKIRNKNITDKN